jgi:hypothetical protein
MRKTRMRTQAIATRKKQMSAFNYRDLVRQVRNQYWEFYFQARKIELPEGATWSQPEKDVQANIQNGFEALDEGRLTPFTLNCAE